MNPATVTVTCDIYANERAEGVRVDAVITMAYDGPINVCGDNEDQWITYCLERLFDAGGVQQAECDIQGFPEAPVGVVVDFSCVYDDADSELQLRSAGVWEA